MHPAQVSRLRKVLASMTWSRRRYRYARYHMILFRLCRVLGVAAVGGVPAFLNLRAGDMMFGVVIGVLTIVSIGMALILPIYQDTSARRSETSVMRRIKSQWPW